MIINIRELTAGTNISISNGTVSNTYSYSLPTASSSTKGGVKVGSGLSIASEVLSVNTGSTSAKGILQVDETASNGVKISVNSGTISAVAVLGTTASAGPVRLATTTEATTGTSEEVAVTPKGLATELAKKAASSHTHSIANVSGLQDALDGKQGTLTAGTGISISSGTVSCSTTHRESVIFKQKPFQKHFWQGHHNRQTVLFSTKHKKLPCFFVKSC